MAVDCKGRGGGRARERSEGAPEERGGGGEGGGGPATTPPPRCRGMWQKRWRPAPASPPAPPARLGPRASAGSTARSAAQSAAARLRQHATTQPAWLRSTKTESEL